ncbi:MAG: hypothetical protein R2764_23165 [Bacteroidales bacterium]
MNGKSKMIKVLKNTLQIMILRKAYLSLIVLFSISITNSCGQESNHDTKKEIDTFIKIAQTKSIEIFDGWNIWKRSDGIVFDYMDDEYRLLIIYDNKEKVLYKEMFPKQDSAFYPLNEIESKSDYYPFEVIDFTDKVFLFEKLKVDRVKSIMEDGLIMFVNEDFSIIFSQKEPI